jgi:anti-sigma regulatory factor (Ser/Thr protein kinase)
MIANAVEHGNLGITASEKEEALVAGRFAALLAERLATPANAAKRVYVDTRLGEGEFRVTVRDEGAGFAWRTLSAEPGASLAGRGVLLARVHFDEVRWNERGNEVTMVKRLP